MESQDVILAKLVLGYLKSENCKAAYREFLRTSSCLQQLDTSHNKYFATRFLGLTLEDILTEYSDLSQIIQGRLEATNYYNEDHPKESLLDQLLYLLNKVPASRPSTPGNSTPQGSYRDGGSPSHSDLDATRADTLPGNTHNKKSCSPRHRGFNRSVKKGPTTSSPIEKQNRSDVFNTEILAENLLINREFHEKIAQTINKVVERQFDTTVQEVMQETEQDPIFDKILDEIIGSSNNLMELSKGSESNNTITSTTNISQENKKDRNDYVEHNKEKQNNDSIKSNIDLQNASFKCPHQKSESSQQLTNLDSYILTNQCSVATNACIQNPVYINTVTGLLIPPLTTVVLNKSQPSPISTAILSEQDIMKMPIILKDDSKNTTIKKKGTKSTSVKTILPKPKIELAADAPKELKDYFKNYRPEEHTESPSTSKPTGLKHVIYPKTSKKSANPVKKSASNLDSNKSNKNNLPIISVDPIEDDDEEDEVIEILDSETKNKTPLSSDPVKKTTPKSGSHVRNLDFSTPLKLNVPKRKSDPTKNSEPASEQKKATKTLFKQSQSKIWDSDLRILLHSGENASPKKSAPTKKSKKKTKKNLNTTEQEGLLLEAAIKTPVKNDTDQTATTSEQTEESEVIPPNNTQSTQTNKIISPFKLNVSKNNIETKSEEIVSKFITPDMAKETTALPIKANRNITPMLETPFKYQHLPKTPGIATPMGFNDDGTPFTKMMLDANLKDMDISSIETPSLLNTPGFPPNTPGLDLISPYANRPTDYSTSSSYYQPSDNEQNKILEAQVREVEKASASINVVSEVLKVTDHVNIFNKNIIGKKNLSLIKKDLPDYEQSENSYSSEEEKDLSMEWCEKESNDTIIFKKKTETPKRTYSLRTRSKKNNSPMKKTSNTKKIIKRPAKVAKKELKNPESRGKKLPNSNPADITGDIKSIISQANEKSDMLSPEEPSMTAATPSQFSMLKDLESKRLRTIDSFKTTEPSSKPKKQVNGKFKIKPIPQVFTTKTGKKAESPRKRKRNKEMLRTVMNDLITSDDSEVHIESDDDDDEEEEKLKTDISTDKVDKQSSDVEAQNLIDGLKERGIHLMQNKSPKKSIDNRDIINTSDLQLETLDRDIFDNKSSEGEHISIIYDENKKGTTLKRAQEMETTEYIGKLYLESIDKEIDIHLKQTDFITLIDIKSAEKGSENTKDHLKDTEFKLEKQIKKKSENKVLNSKEQLTEKQEEISPKINTIEIQKSASILSCHSSKEDEDLMNFAITGKDKIEETASPKSSKKRRLSDDSESENSRTKMLKTLDVDSFLNKIHQKNFRPKK